MSTDEIEHGKEEDPDQIDDVPVQAAKIDGSVILATEMAHDRSIDEPRDQSHAPPTRAARADRSS